MLTKQAHYRTFGGISLADCRNHIRNTGAGGSEGHSRLAGNPGVSIPPLRERKEDIALLAEFFLEQARREYDRPWVKISREVLRILEFYDWPGNVRELRNVVERSIHLARGDFVTPDCLPQEIYKIAKSKESIPKGDSLNILPETVQNCSDLTVVKQIERDMILKTIEEFSGNMTKAAARLHMDRSTLYRKLKKYGC